MQCSGPDLLSSFQLLQVFAVELVDFCGLPLRRAWGGWELGGSKRHGSFSAPVDRCWSEVPLEPVSNEVELG